MTPATLDDFMVARAGTVVAAEHPDKEFDLYSIPSHDAQGCAVFALLHTVARRGGQRAPADAGKRARWILRLLRGRDRRRRPRRRVPGQQRLHRRRASGSTCWARPRSPSWSCSRCWCSPTSATRSPATWRSIPSHSTPARWPGSSHLANSRERAGLHARPSRSGGPREPLTNARLGRGEHHGASRGASTHCRDCSGPPHSRSEATDRGACLDA